MAQATRTRPSSTGATEAIRNRGWLRRGLVIVQFLISAVMVIGSIIISMQMRFIQHKDLGFDKEQILLLSLNDTAVIKANLTRYANTLTLRHSRPTGQVEVDCALAALFAASIASIGYARCAQ